MRDNGFSLYRHYLMARRHSEIQSEIDDVRDDFEDLIQSPAYQQDAKRNGESQPLVVKRKNAYKCEFTVVPGDEMYVGDLVEVLNEDWLVMDTSVDEYGIIHGTMWMCNITFNFQNRTSEIFTRRAVIDDGSYTDTTGKPVSTADAHFVCYISLDEATEQFFIDKRLIIDTMRDAKGNVILQVGRISWLDAKSNNYGVGAHLLAFRLDNDIYNADKDNMENLICDFIPEKEIEEPEEPNEEEPDVPVARGYTEIEGRDTIRLGSSRTYKAIFVDEEIEEPKEPTEDNPLIGETDTQSDEGIEDTEDENTDEVVEKPVPKAVWSIGNAELTYTISEDGMSCTIKIPLDNNYIGETFIITCQDEFEGYTPKSKKVVIIANG